MKKLFGKGLTFLYGNILLVMAVIPLVELITKPQLMTGFSTLALSLNLIILIILMLSGCVIVYFGWYRIVEEDQTEKD
jgi:hypothetical protein|nr:MAG TPA: hypothetical protein [Caudoviricetes sp.]